MNKRQDSKSEEAKDIETDFNGLDPASLSQINMVKDFFKRDSADEMIESLHTMIENFLFTENLARVTPEMRVHIVNNLRMGTLIAKLARNIR
ncbi:hypothetical protein [Dyadobacter arcticus]|uniref:Uncharacterized protein n=1 Tax=Dyadobacter arcticus TaxID=1078754 RepID=A0ABX0UF10_9BACT|nr:hypothetical protein [Dyadobacter arcticus]NIJ51262.1 hypothetical protein [Dyadobacter arcticus]